MTGTVALETVKKTSSREQYRFNADWRFLRGGETLSAETNHFSDAAWTRVCLPHTIQIEPLTVNNNYRGCCWYRKHFTVDASAQGKKVFVRFGAAMQEAEIWINGKNKGKHFGGYLPFTVDLSDDIHFGNTPNILAVRLINTDNPNIPPGRPESLLDFAYFGGLYRNVELIISDRVYISDAVHANQTAGGGVFITTTNIGSENADVQVKVHLCNEHNKSCHIKLFTELIDPAGNVVSSDTTTAELLDEQHIVQQLNVKNPALWHPHHPHLYTARITVFLGKKRIDERSTRFGIHHIHFSGENGFVINDESFKFRGANRHQDFPYIGNAGPDGLQYRDARKLKEAGFDYVRFSHYPQAESFLDACDELGLLVMNCIPGWQHISDEPIFTERSAQNCRDLIRRDRNHPSIVVWELSLNETHFERAYGELMHRIGHDEFPGDQFFTCGWKFEDIWDVWIANGAHDNGAVYNYSGNKALIISEYGDWEYGCSMSSSRQPRSSFETGMLIQAWNHQMSLNKNIGLAPRVGDGLWVFNDHNRGYAKNICHAGPVDIFRIPKYSFYFFQSQRNPEELVAKNPCGAMAYIASDWKEGCTAVRVFSNCEEVALYINGHFICKQAPDSGLATEHLPHPPFSFKGLNWEAGTIEVKGLINGNIMASHSVHSPAAADHIELAVDHCNQELKADGSDILMVFAKICSANGAVVPESDLDISLEVNGAARVIGVASGPAENGIKGFLIQSLNDAGAIQLSASADGLKSGRTSFASTSAEGEYSASIAGGKPPTAERENNPDMLSGKSVEPVIRYGFIRREIWNDIPEPSLQQLLDHPDFPDRPIHNDIARTCAYDDLETNQGQRLRGLLHPDSGSDYIFWLSASGESELWLSPDEKPDNKQCIARVAKGCAHKDWTASPEQQSAPIFLEAGKSYYIELLLTSGTKGPGHFAIAWKNAGLTVEVIPVNFLSPWLH